MGNEIMDQTTADKQRQNSDERDARGRFRKGNARAFSPGTSGNPAGRPKSLTLSEALRHELAKIHPHDAHERTYAEIIAGVMVKQAALGSVIAAKEIADRTEGKARQSVEVDMRVDDWREAARRHGISEREVIAEAQRIIADFTGSGAPVN
jgi:hypothetical protein